MDLGTLDLTFNTPLSLQVYHLDNKAIFRNHEVTVWLVDNKFLG